MAILQNTTVSGSLVITGDLTARQFILSSSVTFYTESFSSGSTRFGDSMDDTMVVTGSLRLTGSVAIGSGSFPQTLAVKISGSSYNSTNVWFQDGSPTDGISFGGTGNNSFKTLNTYGGALYINNITENGVNMFGTSSFSTIVKATSPNVTAPALGRGVGAFFASSANGLYGLYIGTSNDTGASFIQSTRNDGTATAYVLSIQPSGGNVLIGKTSSTGGVLQVSNGTNMFNVDNDANGPYITAVNNANTVYKRLTIDASEILFDISAAEKMRITSAGWAKFSNTGTYASSGGTFHQFNSDDADDTTLQVYASSVSKTGNTFEAVCARSSSNLYNLIAAYAVTTIQFAVRGDGLIVLPGLISTHTTASGANMYADPTNGAIYRSTSSIKYKKNVENYTKGLDITMQLRPVTYQGKNEIDEGKTFAGFIAEEIHDIGLTEYVQYAEDGTPDALAYSHMVTLAFKAIQELKAENDSLKEILTRNNIS